ncbi:hypothetical protein [Microbispora sp. H11081]|uniref:hypothetical protein n=1 Tax=Microbispora sp. H11081 TaxID=2729107 RepID=UPI0014736EBD|nr:hypothetical protein [Microbispora sp. H11081]
MRRLVIHAGTVAALLVSWPAGPAEARAADPLDAFKAQATATRWVKVSETHQVRIRKELFEKSDIRGPVRLGPQGLTAYDLTIKGKQLKGRMRLIALGGYTYASGKPVQGGLPEGKTWWKSRFTAEDRNPFYSVPPIFEPATYKALLASTTKRTGGVRQGAISLGALYKASPSLRAQPDMKPSRREAALKVHWRLWIDRKGLPARFSTTFADPDYPTGAMSARTDMRFSSWGAKVRLTVPAGEKTYQPS